MSARLGLRADISTDARDVFLGDDWYRFLARCRCVVGVEGGASIADRDGALKARTEAYLAEHPGAPFEEVEAACFPGRDGELNLRVITPRHLECCATRTAQVLVEGDYNGVLRPGVHYIPVKRDLSDMAAALRQALDPAVNERITTRAYEDVVASGDWTYARLVREAVEAVRDRLAPAPRTALGEAWASGVHAVLSADERLAWKRQVVLPRAVWELRARLGLLDLRARGRRLLERARGATPPS
jgi:hypothetical protein